ncbi:MAG TPA: sulfite exporter TauE/SafE family protein [Burkholderiales bacterium]|nr:sulfite exporter TauE/SafE family protein [Betaproteobacteria bacterium]HQR51721.1 sulfite exporter TauE/SafE family protein [Burkholderiales bacterium]
MLDLPTTLSGFGVGVIVGLTGIGGGALMTPILVLIFGVAPHTAVGTDLLFACVTKSFGVLVHGRRGTVDWQVVRRLATGSLPAALAVVLLLAHYRTSDTRNGIILTGVGIALVLTATGLLLRGRLQEVGRSLRSRAPSSFKRAQPPLTVLAGAIVGALVALTSVGAGALGTVALVYLYPFRLTAAKLVGTDLAHAIPLALVAGAGHLALGNTDFGLLANLLVGSIPGIMLGATLSTRAPEPVIRNTMACVLLLVAGKLLLG